MNTSRRVDIDRDEVKSSRMKSGRQGALLLQLRLDLGRVAESKSGLMQAILLGSSDWWALSMLLCPGSGFDSAGRCLLMYCSTVDCLLLGGHQLKAVAFFDFTVASAIRPAWLSSPHYCVKV
jgi:hypothetical protein